LDGLITTQLGESTYGVFPQTNARKGEHCDVVVIVNSPRGIPNNGEGKTERKADNNRYEVKWFFVDKCK
jgi:hypothetical protein